MTSVLLMFCHSLSCFIVVPGWSYRVAQHLSSCSVCLCQCSGAPRAEYITGLVGVCVCVCDISMIVTIGAVKEKGSDGRSRSKPAPSAVLKASENRYNFLSSSALPVHITEEKNPAYRINQTQGIVGNMGR